MELSNDQKAILRLLAQRGAAGYDDLTALMGISAAEVHERAKAAAAQLEAEGIPAPSIPAPGSAEAGAPEASAPAQSAEPEPEPPAEPAPVEPPPAPPVAKKPEPAAAKPSAPASATPPAIQRPKPSLPKSGGARAAIAAGVAVLVLLVVVLVVGGGDDSGETTTPSASGNGTEETIDTGSTNPKLTQAVLSPVDGGDAKGLATFGRVKNSLALQIEAEGLAPTEQGQSYTIWLYESAQKMLPLASTVVPASGKIGAQVQVPTEVLAYLAKETFDQIDISLTDDATLKASLAKATREKKAPLYTGTDVLRGTITGPIIGAADKAKAGE